MLARWLTRVMDAQGVWTRPLGDLAHRFLFWLFGRDAGRSATSSSGAGSATRCTRS